MDTCRRRAWSSTRAEIFMARQIWVADISWGTYFSFLRTAQAGGTSRTLPPSPTGNIGDGHLVFRADPARILSPPPPQAAPPPAAAAAGGVFDGFPNAH